MSGFYHIELRDELFLEWLKETENSFVHMIETMKDVAKIVEENTVPITPFDEGHLSGSFKSILVENNSQMKVIKVEMSAVDENGYDYAMIQHENTKFNHPSIKNRNNFHGRIANMASNHPQSKYLMEGIRVSEEGAFQIIEEDYLSLFKRGYIV